MVYKKGIINKRALCAAAFIMSFAVCAVAYTINISNYRQLDSIGRFSAYPLNANYRLTDDIAVPANSNFNPIGTKGAPFTGIFDGNNKKIVGLRIDQPRSGNVGLFGYVGKDGFIRDLGVLDASVTGDFAVGVLAGTNEGRILNCYSTGSVRAIRREDTHAGGLVGVNIGDINKSYSSASVEANGGMNAGGLVGFLFDGSIYESYATGVIDGASNVAGLVGYTFGGKIERCFSAGLVKGTARKGVGGLVGDDFSTSNKSWSVKGQGASGNFVRKSAVVNSFWDMDISGQSGSSSVGGSGKTTEQMLDRRTFTDAGWNFTETWHMSPGSFYPQLREAPICTLIYRAGVNGSIRLSGIREAVYSCTMRVSVGLSGLEVTAVPDNDYEFVRWDDCIGTADECGSRITRYDTAKVNRRVFFIAEFRKKDEPPPSFVWYTSTQGGGLKMSGSDDVIDSYNSNNVKKGTSITVTAEPHEGWNFVRWDDNNSENRTRTDVFSDDEMSIRAKAIFER